MLLEIEVKREIVRLLLSNSHFDFQQINEVTDCAEKLTDFILGKSQTQEHCNPEPHSDTPCTN